MNTLQLVDLAFDGFDPRRFKLSKASEGLVFTGKSIDPARKEALTWEPIPSHLLPFNYEFSYEFSFGRSYLLDCAEAGGGWALSWIIGGLLEPTRGTIYRNQFIFSSQERRRTTWCVRHSEIKRFGLFRNWSVRSQIRYGLRTNPNPFLKTEAAIMQAFKLTLGRYGRPLRQFSHEGWRASCAIGLANGRSIFCFPYLDYLIPEYFDLWLKDMVDLLRDSGALVLIPAQRTAISERLCDEVVQLE
jgi:hypothetical protein